MKYINITYKTLFFYFLFLIQFFPLQTIFCISLFLVFRQLYFNLTNNNYSINITFFEQYWTNISIIGIISINYILFDFDNDIL